MKSIISILTALAIVGAGLSTAQAQDPSTSLGTGPLPSWNDTAPKKAIVAFVEKVTREGSPDFVSPNERIATFDNDGTLWAEQPLYFQFLFAIDRVKVRSLRRKSRIMSSRHGTKVQFLLSCAAPIIVKSWEPLPTASRSPST